MGKQPRISLWIGIGLVFFSAVWGVTTVSPTAAGGEGQTTSPGWKMPALPVLQSTPTSTSTIQSIPSVAIISPSADQVFTADELIPVVARAADPQGIIRIELLVNNKLVARISNMKPQTNRTRTANLSWMPQIVGNQVLQVIAYNVAETPGESELVFMQVLPAPTPTPASPTPTATPSFPYVVVTSASALQVRTGPGTQYQVIGTLLPQQQARITGRNLGADVWWQINFPLGSTGLGWISGNPDYSTAYRVDAVPTVATPPPPTPTASPTPSTGIDFRVDRTEIQRGECVNFFWNAYGVKAVFFQGKGVAGDNQTRRECPPDSTTYTLQVERADGATDTRTIQINVKDNDASYLTTSLPRETKIDFDNGAQVSDDDNDFFWYFEGDQPRFETTDQDEPDIRLAPFQSGNLEAFQSLSQETCRAQLEQHNQPRVNIALDLMVCFSTDQERIGKIRFTGGNRETLMIQWHLW